MGTKIAVAFANIFMAKIEKRHYRQEQNSIAKIDDVFCLWGTNEDDIKEFVQKANHYHDTIKFAAEISDSEIEFMANNFIQHSRRACELCHFLDLNLQTL